MWCGVTSTEAAAGKSILLGGGAAAAAAAGGIGAPGAAAGLAGGQPGGIGPGAIPGIGIIGTTLSPTINNTINTVTVAVVIHHSEGQCLWCRHHSTATARIRLIDLMNAASKLKTKPVSLSVRSIWTGSYKYYTHHRDLLQLSPKADTHFTIPQWTKARVKLAGKMVKNGKLNRLFADKANIREHETMFKKALTINVSEGILHKLLIYDIKLI